MLTKGEIATQALKRIRISGLTSEPDPAELVDAIQELDLMVGLWRDSGITAQYYDSPVFGQPSINQVSGVDREHTQAFVLNLAVNLCDLYGKMPTQKLAEQANVAYSSLFSIVMPNREGNPYLPKGAGSQYAYLYRYNQFFGYEETPPTNSDTQVIALSDTYDYTVNWDDWLVEGATVTSYTINASDGLELISHQQQGNEIYFKVTAKSIGAESIWLQVTSSQNGRVDNRIVNFNVVASKV